MYVFEAYVDIEARTTKAMQVAILYSFMTITTISPNLFLTEILQLPLTQYAQASTNKTSHARHILHTNAL